MSGLVWVVVKFFGKREGLSRYMWQGCSGYEDMPFHEQLMKEVSSKFNILTHNSMFPLYLERTQAFKLDR